MVFTLILAHAEGGGLFSGPLPPVHPIFVNFTAALVPVSVVSDVLGRVLKKPSLTATGWWTLVYAVLVTPLTALAGWYWLRQMDGMDHAAMTSHKWLGTALAFVFIALLSWRWRIQRSSSTPGWAYLACATLVVALLTVQGHLGGTMSFAADESASPSDHMSMPMPADSIVHQQRPNSATAPTSAPAAGIQWKDHIDLKG
jgi:uncharacterized membrane protein